MDRFLTDSFLRGVVLEATRNRAADLDHQTISVSQLDQATVMLLSRNNTARPPTMITGQLIDSTQHRTYLKDMKYMINLANLELNVLEDVISQGEIERDALLDEADYKLASLAIDITEAEQATFGGYDLVHYNTFLREQDQPSNNLGHDPKTNLQVMPSHMIMATPGGITLPIRQTVEVACADIVVEDTRSQNEYLLEWSDPLNLINTNRTFRYVMFRSEFGSTGNIHAGANATLVMELTLVIPQLINSLECDVVAASAVELTSITYINESGETETLTTTALQVGSKLHIDFAPIKAKHLWLTFTQITPVCKTSISTKDTHLSALNETLSNNGFKLQYENPGETLAGWVYDFSMRGLKLMTVDYTELGYWESVPLLVQKLLSFQFSSNTVLQMSARLDAPFGNANAPQTDIDWYMRINLHNKDGKTAFSGLLPLPDDGSQQELFSGQTKDMVLKLFPELYSSVISYNIVSTVVSGTDVTITTSAVHGFTIGNDISFWGPANSDLNGTWRVSSVPTPTSFVINGMIGTTIPSSWNPVLDGTERPVTICWNEAVQNAVLTVKQDGTTLVLGTDYQISLDSGSTWLDTMNRDGSQTWARMINVAGTCIVRLMHPSTNYSYTVMYTAAQNQWLEPTKTFQLNNYGIQSTRLQHLSGTLTTIGILRRSSADQYVTPLCSWYAVRVRSDVP